MSFEDFLFLALVAILFNGVEPLWQSWISTILAHFDPEVILLPQSKFWLKETQRFGKRCRKLIFKMAAVAAILDFLSAHLAILWLLSALMKMAAVAAILDFLSAHLAILWLLSSLMLIIKFAFNWIIEEMSKI